MNWKQVSALAVIAGTLCLSAPVAAQNAEGVAAIVNDHVISTYDVRQRANLLLASARMQATPEIQQRARAQALRDLIDERLQVEEAGRFEITVTPDQVERRLEDIARQNSATLDQFTSSLAQAGVSLASLRGQIEADIAWQRLISGRYGSRVRISEQEITETQQRIAANATRPQYQLSEIFLPAENEQEFEEMMQGGMRLLEQMQRGAPFPAVARQFSAAPSAAAGGDLGWIAAPELAPELQPIAERLERGQVSMPVRTQNGVYIIAMRDRRAGADAGATSLVSLRQITVLAARESALQRLQRRIEGCGNLDELAASVDGASVVDLGQTQESDLSPAIRERINGVATGRASPVQTQGEQASTVVVCTRETGGGGIPSREEIEMRLREQELSMLSDRYLRNLRSEATIITRSQ